MNNFVEYFGRIGVVFIIIILYNGVDKYPMGFKIVSLLLFCMWFLYPGYKLLQDLLGHDTKRSVSEK